MNDIKVGELVAIHSYKHDGKIHRAWKQGCVLDINDDYVVIANDRTMVIEADGRMWYTREPAIIYFFKKKWFNIIGMIREDGIYYYCNISSPFTWDGKVIKYIDYDLDLKIFPDGEYRILDEEEYEYHKRLKKYPKELDSILKYQLNSLIKMVKAGEEPFRDTIIEGWYDYYINELKKVK